MKSIRLSLLVYFLALLAVALGAVSVLVYQTTHQTLLAKKQTTRALIEAQYHERCKEEDAKLDGSLLQQARTLARLVQFLWPTRLRYRELYANLGLITVPASPGGLFQVPAWAAEGARGHVGWELYRILWSGAEIKFDESELHPAVEGHLADYFQIDGAWGGTYRSTSLGARSLPLDPDFFAEDQVLNWKYDDLRLSNDVVVRRVLLRSPAPRAVPFLPVPSARRPGHGNLPGEPLRPAIVIQCASDISKRDLPLAEHQARRDEELAQLDAETDASLGSLRNRLLAIGLFTFAATAVGGFCLVRLGLSPLQRLSEAVSQVSPKDFKLPLDKRSLPCELTTITDRLTQTLDLLKRAFAREKQAAADISHELRTPLTALLTTIEVALRKQRSSEEYRELLADCRESGQQMSRLIERLLALARLDAGVDTLRLQQVDVATLADQCAALVRPLAEARGLRLWVRHDGPASFLADPDKLREVVTNLLHNAIEYNRPEGSVEVSVARQNGHLALEVRDTGIGIAPEVRGQIFERFFRADPSRQADGLHAGLGLAIVKGYVDMMGGTIAVESAEGHGSTFRVELPAGQIIRPGVMGTPA